MTLIVENNLVLLSLVYFVKIIHQREVIGFSAESAQCYLGEFFVILKQGGYALQIKFARDQENIYFI